MPWLVHIPPMDTTCPSVDFSPSVEPLKEFYYRDYPGRGVVLGGINNGIPAVRELVPTAARIAKNRADFYPDFLSLRAIWTVCEVFRAKVEELEPGVHEFFPLALSTKSGQLIAKKYYLMNILNRVDAVDIDRSVLHHDSYCNKYYTFGTGDAEPSIILKSKKIEGMSMWCDLNITQGVFFSDELVKFIRSEKLRRLQFFEAFAA